MNAKMMRDRKRKFADGGGLGWGMVGEAMPEHIGREKIMDPIVNSAVSMASMPKRAMESAAAYHRGEEYDPAPILAAAMAIMSGGIGGVSPGGAVLGSGPARMRMVDNVDLYKELANQRRAQGLSVGKAAPGHDFKRPEGERGSWANLVAQTKAKWEADKARNINEFEHAAPGAVPGSKYMTPDDWAFVSQNGGLADGGVVRMADGGGLPDAPWAESSALPDAPWAAALPDAAKAKQAEPEVEAPGGVEGARQRVASELSGVNAAGPSFIPQMVGPIPARTIAGAARLGANYFTGSDPQAAESYQKGKTTPNEAVDIGTKAVASIPSSAARFVGDMAYPVLHPIETAKSLKDLGLGIAEKTGLVSGNEHIQHADAVGKFFADRYGGIDNVKRTLAEDPVGFAADLSMLFSGGSTLPARAPGIVGEVSRAVGSVGRAIDPLTAAAKGIKAAGSGAAEVIGGLGTHTGGESIRAAARAGYEGGEAGRSFQENLRGVAKIDDAVEEARGALGTIRKERGEAYREGMKGVAGDKTVLDFDKIDTALADISAVKTYKGQTISPSTQEIRGRIGEAVRDWKALDPAEFHTVEGMDALKQKIGDIRDATQYGTPERVVADRAYHSIRNTIVEQAPQYAKVMKGYEEASKQIKEIEKTLSLNPNASIDTALRKLQSVLRNNVNANYGQRAKLAQFLVDAGAPNLMNKLAGQMLSSWTPRGLGKLGMQLGTQMAAMAAGAATAGVSGGAAVAAGLLPFMSPRLMGETAYYAGKGAAKLPIKPAAKTSFQLGREGDPALGRP